MLRNEDIHRQLHEAVNKAKFEIDIISPWMTKYVVNDSFIDEFRQAIARGVIIKIRYGIGDINAKKLGTITQTRSEMKNPIIVTLIFD